MFIQDEIHICIKAYKQALIQEKITYNYLSKNRIQHGICYFCEINNLFFLLSYLKEQNFLYLCDTPFHLYMLEEYDCREVLNKRLQYLENLLITI
jgi:hypothetical protein